MTQAEFDSLMKVRKETKKRFAEDTYKKLHEWVQDFDKTTRWLRTQICPSPITEKRRKAESYDICRAISSRIAHMEGIKGWDIQNAQISWSIDENNLTYTINFSKQ